MNKFKNILDIHGLHIRAEIFRAVVFEFTNEVDRRIRLFHIYTQERIRLVVFEENIVSRLMLFYEIILRHKRVDFARANDIAEVVDVFKHRRNLCRAVCEVDKIGAEPVFQMLRLADVNNFAVFVQHKVYAGIHRHVFQFFLKINHTAIITNSRAKSK